MSKVTIHELRQLVHEFIANHKHQETNLLELPVGTTYNQYDKTVEYYHRLAKTYNVPIVEVYKKKSTQEIV